MLAAMRFFIGLAESTFYPAIQYVIGSWYKNEELAKRACIFHVGLFFRWNNNGYDLTPWSLRRHRLWVLSFQVRLGSHTE